MRQRSSNQKRKTKMNKTDFLPQDAPSIHHTLLDQWLKIKENQMPCRSDFVFDDKNSSAHESYEIIASFMKAEEVMFRFGRSSPDVQKRFGQSLEGHDVKEAVDPNLYPAILKNYLLSIETGQPHYWERYSSFYGRDAQHYKRLLLPLVNEEGETGWLLSSMVWPFHDGF